MQPQPEFKDLYNIIETDAEAICKRVNLRGLAGKTVLITGASGLIGTYLLSCVKSINVGLKAGIKAIALVHSSPPDYFLKQFKGKNIRIIRGDLSNREFCAVLPKAHIIIHAVGYAQPGLFMQNAEKTLKINTLGTFSLLEKLFPKGRFLFISSSEVYTGLRCKKSYSENDVGAVNTDHPRAAYIEGKKCGEVICYNYFFKGVEARSVRLGHIYGPGTKPGDRRVMPAFIEKALLGKLELLDAGGARRCYCYVSDAVEIIWQALLRGKEPLYNVGGEGSISIAGLAKLIGKELKVPVIFPKIFRSVAGAPENVRLNISRAKKEFGKSEFVSLEEGLRRTIIWYRQLSLKD